MQDPELDELMRQTPTAQRPDVLIEHLTPRTATDSLSWIAELTVRAEQYELPLSGVRVAAGALSWRARLAQQRYPGECEWEVARSTAGSRMMRLVLAYVHGSRLRQDYSFERLRRHCHGWLAEFHDDAFVLSMAAFAALGTRASHGLDLFHRALAAPDADVLTREVCLTAIWFADHVDGQPEILLRLADELMAQGLGEDQNVHYRRAAALRKLGRYDEARSDIDNAIGLLGAGDPLVHEQFVQERRAIVAAQETRRQVETVTAELAERITARVDARVEQASATLDERIAESSKALEKRVDFAQDLMSSGLLKMVEILGLFVALLGFFVGSGWVVVKADTFGQRALAMSVVVAGTLIFFGLLRLVTTIRRQPPPAS